jgi:hypothetical protein
MEKEQIYQTIEAYLEGELGPEERTAFEEELATDADLAREVALHRRLQEELGDADKVNLRMSLEAIAKEFPAPDLDNTPPDGSNLPGPENGGGQAGGLPFWIWGLGFFLIVGGGVWYYLSNLPDDPASALLTVEEPAETETDETTATLEEADDTEAPATGESERTAAADAPAPTATPPSDPQLYATNSELESQLGDGSSKRYIFTEGELDYLTQDQQGYLEFSAKLETSRSVEEGFFLTLYNNQYPEGQVMRGQLKFDEISGERKIAFGGEVKKYLAAYSGEVNLKPALYYGVVTTGDSSVVLWADKIEVK